MQLTIIFVNAIDHDIINKINQEEMLNKKKITELFMRKDQPKRQEPYKSSSSSQNQQLNLQSLYFDETYFVCKVIHNGINTSLIKIQTHIKDSRQPLDHLKCKWYLKNNYDFKELEGIHSQYYQPCLDDVGSSICIQIEPIIQGKKYKGITLMKETEVIRLDVELSDKLEQFLEEGMMKLSGRVEVIFSQNQKYSSLEYPVEVKIEITPTAIQIKQSDSTNLILNLQITEEYPEVQFNRKFVCFDSAIKCCSNRIKHTAELTQIQSRFKYKIQPHIKKVEQKQEFKGKFNRKFKGKFKGRLKRKFQGKFKGRLKGKFKGRLGKVQGKVIHPEDIQVIQLQLIHQTNPENQIAKQIKVEAFDQNNIDHPKIKQKQHEVFLEGSQKVENNSSMKIKQIVQKKSLSPKPCSQNSIANQTHLILKIDEQSKQLKILKKKYQELTQNYNLEKTAKNSLENEINKLKKQYKKIQLQNKEYATFLIKNAELEQKNRFYKNELSIVKKQLKNQEIATKQLQQICQQRKDERNMNGNNNLKKNSSLLYMIEEPNRKGSDQYEKVNHQKQQLEEKYEKCSIEKEILENENCLLKKKISSIVSQKKISSIVSQKSISAQQEKIDSNKIISQNQKPKEEASSSDNKKIIENYEFKIKYLEKLLTYHKNTANSSSSTNSSQHSQQIINSLTEIITEKEIEIQSLKNINKELLLKIQGHKP